MANLPFTNVRKINENQITRAAQFLRAEFGFRHTASYFRGKTRFRDQLHKDTAMSSLESEQMVDALETRGWLQFWPSQPIRLEAGLWTLGAA